MKKSRWSVLLGVLGLGLCGATLMAPPAFAAKPECSVENLPPHKRSYNSITHANPLGTAIAEAKAGDTLQVIGTCRGNFFIDKSLALQGRAAATRVDTLDGNGSGAVLKINGGATNDSAITVEVRNLTITHGEVGITRSASPISQAFSNVTLTDSIVRDNTGYGIRDAAFSGDGTCRGALTLNRSTVQHNGSGGILMGHSCTPYTFNYSTVIDNAGIAISAPTSLLAFVGGVTLNHSTVSRNDGGIGWSRGGALTIRDSMVNDNRGAGVGYGGRGSDGPVIDNSIISGNNGGGIVASFTTLTLTDSTVIGNSTAGNGGGILLSAPSTLTVTGSTLSGNAAAGDGGGIWSNSNVMLRNSTVSGNSAAGSGGGVYNSADFAHLGQGTVTLAASTVSGNTAGVAGGGIFNELGGSVILDAASSVCGNSPDDWQGCLP